MILEYKDAGLTIDQFIKIIKQKYPDNKIAYAGRLDPMARGLVPILFDEECYNMEQYTTRDKVYRVKVIVGVQTDSDDPLGIIQNTQNDLHSMNNIEILIVRPQLSFYQSYHYFSTKQINSRRKNKDTISGHIVSLYKSSIISKGTISSNEWIDTIDKVDKNKNFRQKEIIEQWSNFEKKIFDYIELEIHVSSGFFVRQFIRDTSDVIGIPLMCYDIHRTFI